MEANNDGEAFDLHACLASKSDALNSALDLAVPLRPPLLIHEAIRYSLLAQGDRIHPFLCLCACELLGGSEQLSMPTACALEMVHAASLIHDDLPCMDDDDLRRGKPTNHKLFGEDMAILAGDALYALAIEHVARVTQGVSGDKILRVIAELSRTVGSKGMVAGQFLDLLTAKKSNLDVAQLESIHLRKTAVLCECSMVCGAILGGAKDEEIETLRHYGRALGLLYQAVSDMLEGNQFSTDLGKPPNKTLSADRATYPKLLGFEKTKDLAEEWRCRARQSLISFNNAKAAPLLCFVDFVAGKIQSI